MEHLRFDPQRSSVNPALLEALKTPVHEYHFEFQKFRISETRAAINDTDTVSFAMKDGSKPTQVVIKHMGDVDNGEHLVQLKIGPIIFQADEQVNLVTAVINSGHKDQAELDERLTTAANQAIDLALDEIPGRRIDRDIHPLAGQLIRRRLRRDRDRPTMDLDRQRTQGPHRRPQPLDHRARIPRHRHRRRVPG